MIKMKFQNIETKLENGQERKPLEVLTDIHFMTGRGLSVLALEFTKRNYIQEEEPHKIYGDMMRKYGR